MSFEPRWLSAEEQRTWRNYYRATRLLQVLLERHFQQHGLSSADYEVLVYLSEAPRRSLRMGELAKGTLLEKSRLSHQITRMERAGLVRREACPDDRRGQLAVLTEQGWETIQRVAPDHVEMVRRLLIDRLSPEQLNELNNVFEPLVHSLNDNCSATEARGDAEPQPRSDIELTTRVGLSDSSEILDDAQRSSDPSHSLRIGDIDHVGKPSLHRG